MNHKNSAASQTSANRPGIWGSAEICEQTTFFKEKRGLSPNSINDVEANGENRGRASLLPKTCSLAVTALLLLLCQLLQPLSADPGLKVVSASPDYATSEYRMKVEDMRVKVLGGYVRMVRTWIGGEWVWNRRWSPLELKGLFDEGKGVNLPEDIPNVPDVVVRNGSLYIWQYYSTAGYDLVSGTIYAKSTNRSYYHDANKRIELVDGVYTWYDRLGNTIRYGGAQYDADSSFLGFNPIKLMSSYSDSNGNTVTLNRDANHDHRIVSVNASGQIVINYEYNAEGQLIGLRDYSGREVKYNYDENGQLEKVTDVLGEAWTYDYAEVDDSGISSGMLKGYTDPTGHRVALDINSEGILRGELGDDGVGADYKYNYTSAQDQYYQRRTDSSGQEIESWYNAQGHIARIDVNSETQYTIDTILSDNSTDVRKLIPRTSSNINRGGSSSGVRNAIVVVVQEPVYIKRRIYTDSRGNKTEYEYDLWRNVVKIRYPDGGTASNKYSLQFNRPLSEQDDSGVVTEYQYDSRQNLIKLIEAKGLAEERTTLYAYDSHGNVTKITYLSDANTAELIETFSYDNYGNVITAIDGAGTTLTRTYDVLGNELTLTDGRDKIWLSSYDAIGNLLSQTDPDGRTINNVYDKAGKLVKVIGVDGTEINMAFNGRLLESVVEPSVKGPQADNSPDGFATTFQYDKAGRIIGITDPTGRTFQTQYDAYGRIQKLIDGNNNETEYSYENNQISEVKYPTFEEQNEYDNRDALSKNVINQGALVRQRQWQYDRDNRITTLKDAEQNDITTVLDGLGRITKQIDAKGGEILYQYDDRDNLLSASDQEGRTSRFEYDLKDRVIAEIKANNERTEYHYDATDNLIEIISANNEKSSFSYSDAGLLTEAKYYANSGDVTPQKTVTYSYDENGLLSGYNQVSNDGQDDDTTCTSYQYDARYQLISETVNYGDFSKTWSYSYYANGLKKSYTNPEGVEYGYEYDGNRQLTAVSIPDEGTFSINDYEWLAPKVMLYPGGGKRIFTYDEVLRLISTEYTDPGDNTKSSATYAYDNEDNITAIQTEHGDYQYQYDENYQLTHTDNPTGTNDARYSYDGVGNRLTNSSNLIPIEGEQPTVWQYNANNQLLSTGNTSYEYDANGSLIRKSVSDNGNVTTTEYSYNAEKRLISISQGPDIIASYSYDPYGRRTSKTIDGVTTYYLYSQEGLSGEYDSSGNLITEYHYQPNSLWSTNPLFMRQNGEVYYYHNNHLGTPQTLFNKAGKVVWEARYTAFGQATIITEQITQNLRMPGQYYDAESGLHYNYLRHYDPQTGRYIQEDSLGIYGGINVYAYVYNNPIIFFDQYGLWKWGDPIPLVDRLPRSTLQGITNFSAGFGDTISLGITFYIRGKLGTNDIIELCSGAYLGGVIAGTVVDLFLGGKGAVKVGGKLKRTKGPKVASKTGTTVRDADWFEDVARNATRNADSDKLVLGHFSPDGRSYQKVASHYKASYFKVDDWNKVTKGLSENEIWKINKSFLTQQVTQGKQILFSHNPVSARSGSFFEKEVDFLRDLGYSFKQKNQWTWEAVR